MKMFGKDGGPESKVWGYFFEIKRLFSVVLLRFEDGSREAYHSHAFNSWNWVLKGRLHEYVMTDHNETGTLVQGHTNHYKPGWHPVKTLRSTFHKVRSEGRSWVLSIRGPWSKTWQELVPGRGVITLTHGRREVPDVAEQAGTVGPAR